jgi:hypothetical protein
MLRFVIVSVVWVAVFYGAFKLWAVILRRKPPRATAAGRAMSGSLRAAAAVGAVLLSAFVLYSLTVISLTLG